MKNLSLSILFAFLLLTLLSFCVSASYDALVEDEIKTLYSDSILLANVEESTGEVSVIYQKNADVQRAPASLTKMASAIVVMENCENLQETVTVSAYALHLLDGTGASMAGLVAGEELTVEELLYCMLVKSGCDASTVLAEHISGSQEAFVAKMNETVLRLGCNNTQFQNSHGLDEDGQLSTARDLLLIGQRAMAFPLLEKIVATGEYELRATNLSAARNLYNTNFTMRKSYSLYYQPDTNGIKTGYTEAAERCILTRASKNGYTYYAVVLHGPLLDVNADGVLDNCAFVDSKNLLNWAFKNMELAKVADPVQIVSEIACTLSGTTDYIRLVPAGEIYALVPGGVGQGSVLLEAVQDSLPEGVQAPVKKGTVLGKAQVKYANEVIATVDLVAEEDVSRNPFLYAGFVAKGIISSRAFKLIALLLLLVILGYVVLVVYVNAQKRKKRKLRVMQYRDRNQRRHR